MITATARGNEAAVGIKMTVGSVMSARVLHEEFAAGQGFGTDAIGVAPGRGGIEAGLGRGETTAVTADRASETTDQNVVGQGDMNAAAPTLDRIGVIGLAHELGVMCETEAETAEIHVFARRGRTEVAHDHEESGAAQERLHGQYLTDISHGTEHEHHPVIAVETEFAIGIVTVTVIGTGVEIATAIGETVHAHGQFHPPSGPAKTKRIGSSTRSRGEKRRPKHTSRHKRMLGKRDCRSLESATSLLLEIRRQQNDHASILTDIYLELATNDGGVVLAAAADSETGTVIGIGTVTVTGRAIAGIESVRGIANESEIREHAKGRGTERGTEKGTVSATATVIEIGGADEIGRYLLVGTGGLGVAADEGAGAEAVAEALQQDNLP